jgi:uncharacterized protein (DUF433 family)
MEVSPGISMDPAIRFGKACLSGTRIDVATVVGALAAGESFDVIEDWYALTREQVLTALRFAAHVAAHLKEPRTQETGNTALLPADERVVTLPTSKDLNGK